MHIDFFPNHLPTSPPPSHPAHTAAYTRFERILGYSRDDHIEAIIQVLNQGGLQRFRLEVILKATCTTVEEPAEEGGVPPRVGDWHSEDTDGDNIVAVGLYYYHLGAVVTGGHLGVRNDMGAEATLDVLHGGMFVFKNRRDTHRVGALTTADAERELKIRSSFHRIRVLDL